MGRHIFKQNTLYLKMIHITHFISTTQTALLSLMTKIYINKITSKMNWSNQSTDQKITAVWGPRDLYNSGNKKCDIITDPNIKNICQIIWGSSLELKKNRLTLIIWTLKFTLRISSLASIQTPSSELQGQFSIFMYRHALTRKFIAIG